MWQLKKYRGKYAAVGRIQNRTVRRSLSTKDEHVAKQRFDDFKKLQAAPNETVKEIYDAYANDRSPNEKKKLEIMWGNLEQHFKDFRPDQIDREKAKNYTSFRQAQNISDNTIIRELGALRAALRWYNRAYPKTFYMPSKPAPKDRSLSRKEYNKLLESAESPHIRLFVILALATAGRTGAILELTWSQIDFKRKMVDLGKGTKIKRRATVPLNETAMEALKEAYKLKLTDYVIEYAGKPVQSIRKGFDAAVERAKLKGVTPHVIRHTAAVWMAESGITMPEIAQFLGHSSTAVTEKIYARFSPNYLRRGADVLQ